ncbi:YybH family protein [Tautonia plasticadhaerens]|uniref:SnoaL-like domain protein n=1 Tax=Tautonia plasticadhaerens TaxID=2527974 RepID=A0A518HCG9_9BACT|nr:SgcJ/EcaC family oxidoreductase [Tautonia plasticadhaerens]QDV38537.1 SnoaL-like domain protein [Tautonia plasticadhaerens]
MRTFTTLIAPIVALSLLVAPVAAQQQETGSGEEAMQLAREQTESYVAAYNAHDVAALATRYTPDADWISSLGDEVITHHEGRAAIEQFYRETFANSPQIRAQLTTEHARFVTPDVLVSDLTWSVTNSTRTDRPSRGRGTVVSLRGDDRWMTCCVRLVMTPPTNAGR